MESFVFQLMIERFHAEQWLPHPLPQVFAFFADPWNLLLLMPPAQDPRIDQIILIPPAGWPEHEGSPLMAGSGTQLTISFRPVPFLPLRLRWRAEIPEFVWNSYFCDVQLSGPFRRWRHCHQVRDETRNNTQGTLVTDDVEYELPLTPISWPAQPFVHRRLRDLFAFRHILTQQELARLAQAPPLGA